MIISLIDRFFFALHNQNVTLWRFFFLKFQILLNDSMNPRIVEFIEWKEKKTEFIENRENDIRKQFSSSSFILQ